MNRNSRNRLIAALLVSGAISAVVPAFAQEQDAPRPTTRTDVAPTTDAAIPAPRTFAELDANGDGSIAKDEAAADPALTQAFGTLDQDADGKLAPAEYAGYRPSTPQAPSR